MNIAQTVPPSPSSSPEITDDRSYEAALDELEDLWDAAEDTPEGRRFDALVASVMEFEDRNGRSDGSERR